jgi:hypothetical protein
MSAEAPIVTRTFPVGKFKCTVSIRRPTPAKRFNMLVEWSPWFPLRGQLSSKNLRQYQRGRDGAIAEYTAATGLSVLVVE